MTEQEEIEQVAQIISAPAGCCVSLFDMLFVYRLEDGRFALLEEETGAEAIYNDARGAAEAFVVLRRKKKLGFDMETAKG